MITPGLLLISTNTLLGRCVRSYRQVAFDLVGFVVSTNINGEYQFKIYVYSIIKVNHLYPICMEQDVDYDKLIADESIDTVYHLPNSDIEFMRELNINYITNYKDSNIIYALDIMYYLKNPKFNWQEFVGPDIDFKKLFPNYSNVFSRKEIHNNPNHAQSLIDFFSYCTNIVKDNPIILGMMIEKFANINVVNPEQNMLTELLDFTLKIKNQTRSGQISMDLREFNDLVKKITKTDPMLHESFSEDNLVVPAIFYHRDHLSEEYRMELGIYSRVQITDPINILFTVSPKFYAYLSSDDLLHLEKYCVSKKYPSEIYSGIKDSIAEEISKRYVKDSTERSVQD